MLKKLGLLALLAFMATPAHAQYYGDIAPSGVIDKMFDTWDYAAGTPTTFAGSPAISCYKDNGNTESTAGITLGVDADGRTGMNRLRVDTSADGTFYAAGSDFQCVVTSGTVSSLSWVGHPVVEFSISHRSGVTLDNKLGAFTGSGVNTVLGFFKAIAKKDASNPSDMGGSFDAATDALEAQQDSAATLTTQAADNINDFFDNGSAATTATVANIGSVLSATVVRAGTAQNGAARTITLDSGASATDNLYNGNSIVIISSTGVSQRRTISSYVGSTKIATVDRNWVTNPTSSSVFMVIP